MKIENRLFILGVWRLSEVKLKLLIVFREGIVCRVLECFVL